MGKGWVLASRQEEEADVMPAILGSVAVVLFSLSLLAIGAAGKRAVDPRLARFEDDEQMRAVSSRRPAGADEADRQKSRFA